MNACPDGRACLIDDPECHARRAGLCGRAEYLDVIRRETDRRRGQPIPAPRGGRQRPRPARFPASDPRPRACLVTPSLSVGGAERWMVALMAETRHALAWSAVAVTTDSHTDPAMVAEAGGLAPILIGDDGIDAALAASDVCVTWGCDLARLADAADRHKVPIVAVSHGVGEWTVRVFYEARRAAALAGVARATLRTFPIDQARRARIIENCAEPRRLVPRAGREATRAAWGISPEEKALVMVGRLSDEKNPWAVAVAVAELHRRGHAEWRGVHVGSGWQDDVAKRRAEVVAPGVVRFPGVTDDVGSAYLAADALCQPSREEACGLAILEAWWVGVPIISARVGLAEEPEAAGWCRVVSAGCSGVELAEAVLADEADPEGTVARAVRAKAGARVRFSPERFGKEWSELIVATARPRPEPALPPAWTTATNAGASLVRNAATGFAKAPEDVRVARLAACESCPSLRASDCRCSACSCFVDLKTTLAAEACPEGKWGAVARAVGAGCGSCGK